MLLIQINAIPIKYFSLDSFNGEKYLYVGLIVYLEIPITVDFLGNYFM